ncbi:MAG: sigma factor, partial [Allgaiera sp.]|nr:sigma factor [Allgaiera sp.]
MTMPYDAMTEAPDDALLALYANGDGAAARVLTERLAPRVLRFAARMLSDPAEAEDVTQEALLR